MRGISFTRWLSLFIGILLIIGGGLHLFNPIEGTIAVVKLFSIILILIGIIRIIRYFSSYVFKTGSFLIGGILDIVLGTIMYRNLETSALAFGILIGFWILFNGIIEIAAAIDFKKLDIKRWWLALITGIIGVVFGFLLINNPLFSAIYLNTIIALYLFISGISFISTFFVLSKFRGIFL